jgi:surface antigen
MKTMFRRYMLVLVVGLVAPLAQAAGWGGVLLHGPGEDFNDEDVKLYLETVKKALDAPGDPQPHEWRNEQSGAGGSFLVVGRPKVKGFDECRKLRGTMYSARRKGGTQSLTACKDPGGRWKLLSAG